MWDLPGPGLKAMSPALVGGFLTTAPPGKPHRGSSKCLYVMKCQKDDLNVDKYILCSEIKDQGLFSLE